MVLSVTRAEEVGYERRCRIKYKVLYRVATWYRTEFTNFSCKGQVVNISGFAGCIVSVGTAL